MLDSMTTCSVTSSRMRFQNGKTTVARTMPATTSAPPNIAPYLWPSVSSIGLPHPPVPALRVGLFGRHVAVRLLHVPLKALGIVQLGPALFALCRARSAPALPAPAEHGRCAPAADYKPCRSSSSPPPAPGARPMPGGPARGRCGQRARPAARRTLPAPARIRPPASGAGGSAAGPAVAAGCPRRSRTRRRGIPAGGRTRARRGRARFRRARCSRLRVTDCPRSLRGRAFGPGAPSRAPRGRSEQRCRSSRRRRGARRRGPRGGRPGRRQREQAGGAGISHRRRGCAGNSGAALAESRRRSPAASADPAYRGRRLQRPRRRRGGGGGGR